MLNYQRVTGNNIGWKSSSCLILWNAPSLMHYQALSPCAKEKGATGHKWHQKLFNNRMMGIWHKYPMISHHIPQSACGIGIEKTMPLENRKWQHWSASRWARGTTGPHIILVIQRRHHQLGSKQSLAWMSWSRAFGIAWCSHQGCYWLQESMRVATWQKNMKKMGSVTINRWGVTSKNIPVIPMFIQRFSHHIYTTPPLAVPTPRLGSVFLAGAEASVHPSGANDEIQWLCKKRWKKMRSNDNRI